jgi:hypothetical protein
VMERLGETRKLAEQPESHSRLLRIVPNHSPARAVTCPASKNPILQTIFYLSSLGLLSFFSFFHCISAFQAVRSKWEAIVGLRAAYLRNLLSQFLNRWDCTLKHDTALTHLDELMQSSQCWMKFKMNLEDTLIVFMKVISRSVGDWLTFTILGRSISSDRGMIKRFCVDRLSHVLLQISLLVMRLTSTCTSDR